MPKHGACNLGSINLSEFVHNPFTKDAYFDTSDFVQTVHIAVRGLDEVIDENLDNHALPEQRQMAENYRNIGLGIMGLHDALIKMGMTYGSEESIDFTNEIMYLMFRSAVVASSNLAKEKGAFPAYNHKLLDSEIIFNHFTSDEIAVLGLDTYGLRNCSLLSIAPTGTLGTMLNISTGCEPLFALYYTRKTESLNNGEDKYYKVYSGVVKEYVEKYGDTLPAYFVSSGMINWQDRIKMQAALQDHVDTAISSTINLPEDITVDEIERLYLCAWENGLKGITIFRDGCKRLGILTHGDKTESKDEPQPQTETFVGLTRGEWKKIAPDTVYYKRKIKIGCGKLNLFIGWSETEKCVQELWVKRTGQGGCEMNIQASVIAMSGMLRLGGNIFNIEKAFDGLGACNSFISARGRGRKLSKGSSCATAILNEIKAFLNEIQGNDTTPPIPKKTEVAVESQTTSQETKQNNKSVCPECGEPLTFEGGCNTCKACGYSKCD